LTMAEAITGRRIRVEVNPAFVRRNDVKILCGDPSKLRSLIGDWETPPLEATLGWMLETK
ncbi:MAG TPA: GDP-mannose 4,6 dehydratase, partial [Desulfobulbaceae bacterium]|nr:GDP-mannose 4,6 dehydratase [Desulfobulbaceae bacterium]